MRIMDNLRALFKPVDEQEYEPLEVEARDADDNDETTSLPGGPPFSWLEYSVFLLLGVAMLWAWNMFLAAAPYFAKRFASNEWILVHFEPFIVSVGNITNFVTMIILVNLQLQASYLKRIAYSLVINVVMFTLLALSTTFFRDVSAGIYLVFILAMVFCTSFATGLCQNGAFAFASGFGNSAYTQAIMTGQAIAGVLPPIAQIVSVLALPPTGHIGGKRDSITSPSGPPGMPPPQESPSAAMTYFLTATALSAVSLLALFPLVRRHNQLIESRMIESITSVEETGQVHRKAVGLLTLYKKLYWLSASIFICFAVTMFFPLFTTQIISNTPPDKASRLFQSATFIPLAFLFWNVGDLLGRLATLLPFSLRHRPGLLFVVALARIGFLPLYLLCNIGGHGAVIPSDAFYLIIVQLGFGLTNGWLGSSCMMGAGEWVEEDEREATGGFMVLNFAAGLMVGSLLSFTAASPP